MIVWLTRIITHFFCETVIWGPGKWFKDEQVIITPNHISMWDGFIILATLPVVNFKFMVATKYYNGRVYSWPLNYIVHWLLKHSGVCIPATFRIAKETLSNGYSLVIFPEGRVSKTGRLGRLRHGAAYFHVHYEIPILPVKIEGTNVPGLFKHVKVTYGSLFRFMGPLKAVNKKLKEGMKRL